MERFIPQESDLNRYYGLFFENYNKKDIFTIEDYLTVIKKYEIEVEDYFNELFSNLGIQSSVKTERYSLPFNNEIIHIQEGKMNLYKLFNLRDFGRIVIKKLLYLELTKIRFYILGDVIIQRHDNHRYVTSKIVLRFRFLKS